MRTATIDLLKASYGRYAVGAFNVSNLEQIHGLFRGAARAQAPIIVQFTRAIRNYAHPQMLAAMVRAAEAIYPQVSFSMHLDHGDEAACADAIVSEDYSSVMIDASHLAFEENVAVTRRVVEQAHAQGIAVEAELGLLKGIEDGVAVDEQAAILTDPSEAEEFVSRTGCDSLAVAIGTSHGAYKFAGKQRLHLDRLREIQARLPRFPLVLHGGSAVPLNEIERINSAGGAIDSSAGGVSDQELLQAISFGITKVNIGTDGRLIWTRVHREFFSQAPQEFDFMLPGKTYVEEYAVFVAAKCQKLGADGAAQLANRGRPHASPPIASVVRSEKGRSPSP
ncbi:MAG: class II fructose-bisphosphate aldolase [Verrucomicrobiales bacterium]|nr:class II fructose-bisphosphate aldolase [Verrucomicrobiales bacterium]